MKRVRSAGYERGEAEAKLFKLAVGNDFNRWQAISWINAAIEDGLGDWRAQRALDREIGGKELRDFTKKQFAVSNRPHRH
jgi:hypothetical protein